MGLEFLARVRKTSGWVGALAALLTATYVRPVDGVALALGIAWSLVNLALLERLIVALTGPGRGELPALRRVGMALLGMLALFAAGAALLSNLPPHSLLWGFLVPFAVIVLKALSLLVLGSKAWQRFARRPRRVAILLVLLLPAAWAATPLLAGAGSGPAKPVEHASGTAAEHGSDAQNDEHARSTERGAGHGAAKGTGEHAEHGAAKGTGEHGESAEHGTPHGAAEGPQKFANLITIVSRAFPEAGWAHFLHEFEVVIFALFIAFLLGLVAYFASRNAQMIPGRLQNVVESLVEVLHDFVVGILGPRHGPRYVPFLGTLFIYILVMNVFGLIPFMESPTSNLNVPVALAVTVFLYAQYIGFRHLGLVGYLDHMAGNPRSLTQWLIVPLMLPIHVLGEFAKPISLSARLFGNIFGEDMLLVAFATLGVTTLAFTGLPLGLPLQFPFLLLALLTSTLQALVFTVLSTIYFLLMLPHDDHEHSAAHSAH